MRPSRAAVRRQQVLSTVMGDRQADPRAWQGTFLALLLVAAALLVVGSAPVSTRTPLGQGIVLAVVVTLVAFVVPWERLSRWWVMVLPTADIGVLGLAGLDDAGEAVAPLLVIPAIWSAVEQGRRGVWTTGVATFVLYGVPGIVATEEGAALAWAVMIPLAVMGLAAAVAWLIDAVRAESAVAAHHRRVADAILDTVDVGLVLLDADGRYATMNRRHADFMALAYPGGHDGGAGQTGEVFAEDGTTELSREDMPTWRAVHGEEFDDCRVWIGKDPLTCRALSVSARSVRDGDGDFVGAALAYKDVTEFMRALQVKDDFVASVSHELRTPLTSIRGYTDLVLELEDLPALAVRQLEVVLRNAERLHRLVEDLLHTAQAGAGPVDVVRQRGDLVACVREALDGAAPAARAASTRLVYSGPEELDALVDPLRMRQVVDNLVSNAIKYSPPGGEVVVRLGLDLDRVELAVADQGIGISPADRDRLFTRFWRSPQSEDQGIPGAGLGLSITKAIVESHGGRIEVDSEVGVGSTFRVRLPLDGG